MWSPKLDLVRTWCREFLDIKCRKAEAPQCCCYCGNCQSFKIPRWCGKSYLNNENVAAVEKGFANLQRHIENIQSFGLQPMLPSTVLLDTEAESKVISDGCDKLGVKAVLCSHWANGSKGTKELAEEVVKCWW